MPGERELQFLRGNSAAVVRDGELLDAPLAQPHLDAAGARIHGVFHKLLHDGGRTVNDFARRNLADELVGQGMNGPALRQFVRHGNTSQ